MKPLDVLLWRIAGWVCVGLMLICVSHITGALDGTVTPHLIGWVEGLLLSTVSAWTCFEIVENME